MIIFVDGFKRSLCFCCLLALSGCSESNRTESRSSVDLLETIGRKIVEPNVGNADIAAAMELGILPDIDRREGEEISISLDDMPLADALRIFEQVHGSLEIRDTDDLVGSSDFRVTVEVHDVFTEDVLGTVLVAAGLKLSASPDGGFVIEKLD